MSDMKILLTADLNIPESVKDINNAILKIQKQIIKLHLEVDTSGIKNAQIILDKFGNQVKQQQQKMKKVSTSAVSSMGDETLRSLEARVARINATLSAGNKTKVSVQTDENNKVRSATLEYKDSAGQLVREKMELKKFVNSVVTGTDANGKKIRELQEQTVLKTTSKQFVDNLEQSKKATDNILKQAQKGASDANLKKIGFFDEKKISQAGNAYQKVADQVQNIIKANGQLNAKEQEFHQRRLDRINTAVAKQIAGEKEIQRISKLGMEQTAKLQNFDFANKGMAMRNQIAGQLQGMGLQGTIDPKKIDFKRVVDPKTNKELIQFNALMETGKNTFSKYSGTVSQAANQIGILGDSIKSTANRNLDFMSKFRKAMESIPIWMAGMTAFYQTLHFFTDGIAYVNEFNKSLTELSIVFMQSQDQVAHYGETFHNMGMEMGISTEEIAKGAVEFARQGMTYEDTLTRMRQATMYAKISNIDFATSAKIITATVNSMNIDAERAIDVFSYMGDATATGADELGQAMQRVGGTAGAVGIEFEKVASWIAVVSSKTRESAYTIGNSIKSILARIQSMKETGFDETDGTKVNDVAKALATVDIALMNADGTFRDFGAVMDELGGKWDKIDNRTKAYLATTVAGSYQQARFLNLMEGYPETISLYEQSLTKAGIAQDKFNLYQEGTEAHLTKLKNAWTGIFQTTFDSDGLRTAIDLLTGIASAFDSLVKSAGALPLFVGVATTALLLMSGKARDAYVWMGKLLSPTQATMNALPAKLDAVASRVGLVGTSARNSTLAVRGLAISLRFLMSTFLPLLAVMAVGTVISKVSQKMEEAKQKAEELAATNKKIATSWMENKESVNKLVDEYVKLDTASKNGTAFLSDESEERYYKVMNDLGELLPNLVEKIDDKGQAHLKNSQYIQDEIEYVKKLAEEERKSRVEKSKDATKGIFDNVDKAKSKADKTRDEIREHQKWIDEGNRMGMDMRGTPRAQMLQDAKTLLVSNEREIARATNEVRAHVKSIITDVTSGYSNLTDVAKGLQEQLNSTIDSSSFSNEEETNAAIEKYKSLLAMVDDFKEKMKSGGSVPAEETAQAMNDIRVAAKDLGIKDVFKFTDAMISAEKKAEDASKSIKSFATLNGELIQKFEDASDSLSILNGLLDDNAKGKRLSADEVAKLVKQDASMVDMFKIENGQISLNTEAINKRKNAMIEGFAKEAEAQQKSLITANSVLNQKLALFGLEITGLEQVSKMQDEINKKYDEQIKKNLEAQPEEYRGTGMQYGVSVASNAKADATKYLDELKSLQGQAKLYGAALNTVGQDKTEPKEEKEKREIEAFDDAAQKFKDAIYDIDTALKNSESLLEGYANYSQEYRDELEKEMKLLEEKKDLYHDENNRLRERKTSLEGQVKAMGNFNSLSDENKDKLNDLKKDLADVTQSIKENSASWEDANILIKAKDYETFVSKLNEFTNANDELNDSLAISKDRLSTYEEGSASWRDEVASQISMYKALQEEAHQQKLMIDEEIASDKLNAAQKEELKKKILELQKAWWSYESTIKSMNDQVKQKSEDTAKDVIDFMKDMYSQQKELADRNIQDQLDSIDEIHDAEMESIDDRIDAYDKLIKSKKDALTELQDDRKYQQELNQKQKDRQKIQSQIDVLSLDKTPEGIKKLRDLKKQLAEADMEIDNMKYDHSIETQQDALDKQADAEKERLEAEKENAEVSITIKGKEVKMKYKLAVEALNDEKIANDRFYDDILNDEQRWSKTREEVMAGHFANLQTEFTTFRSFIETNAKELGSVLQTNLIDRLNTIEGKGSSVMTQEQTDIQSMISNGNAWNNTTNQTARDFYASENQKIGKKNGWIYDSSTGSWWKDRIGGTPLFHEGGVVEGANKDSGGSSRMTSLVNKLFNVQPNEQVVKALHGELFVPEKNIVNNFIPNMQKLRSLVQMPSVLSGAGDVLYNINVAIDKVIGDEKGAETIANKIVTSIQKRGGRMG